MKRIVSLLLALVMLCGLLPQGAMATETPDTADGLCSHQHDESCYTVECNHVHGECGYVEENPEIPCSHDCAQDTACNEKILNCTHVHDDSCGYVETKEDTDSEVTTTSDEEIGSGTPDGTPPILNSISLSATSVAAPAEVEIIVDSSDDISGMSHGKVIFYCEETEKSIEFGCSAYYYDSNTQRIPYPDGKMHGIFPVDEYLPSGTYTIQDVILVDRAGNSCGYGLTNEYGKILLPDTLQQLCIEIQGTELTDVTPPVLHSVQFSEETVQAPGSLNIIMNISDDISGMDHIQLTLYCPETGRSPYYGFHNVYYDPETGEEKTYLDGEKSWEISVSEYEPSGVFYVKDVVIVDVAGNSICYAREPSEYTDALPLPNDAHYTVVGTDTPDNSGPILHKLSISSTRVTAPGTLDIIVDATDDVSGLSTAQVRFFCETAQKNLYINCDTEYYDSEQDTFIKYADGKLHGTMEIDQYLETGTFYVTSITLIDYTGNRRTYGIDNGEPLPDVVAALRVEVFNTTPDVTTSVSKGTFVDEIANAGSDAYIAADYSGNATMPKEAFQAIMGTDKTIDLISDGITWRFEGSDITAEIKDIDLKVDIQKVEDDSSASGDAIENELNGNPGVVMKFPENGTLPGKATIQVKVDYAMRQYLGSGEGLSVYYYNNQTGELELIASNLKVINDTYVEFPITHCSYYVLTNPNGSNGGSTAQGIAVDKTNFPDENFRAWILDQDYGMDGLLTPEELANVTWIEVQEKNIKDLTGIEHFTALQYLYCYDNQLTSLDVSRNTALINLACAGNQLTSLNVGKCTALTELGCHSNQLTSLDITGCTALKRLDCDSNLLTSLDLSQNTDLSSLNCGNNLLTSLNLNSNKALAELTCSNNQLSNLTVSDCIALTFLDCSNNQLTSLDLSKNIALTSLLCYKNQLKELDMSGNPALKTLHCYENQLTKLNIRNNAVLDDLGCDENQLTELDVTQNTALVTLACGINQIKSLDVRNCTELEFLECDDNKITELDLSNNPLLTELSCDGNLLTVLDLSKNTKLKQLQCCSNQLASLDLSNNSACTDVMAHGNRRTITVDSKNEFVLTSLQGFDVSKASNWTGGIVSNGVLTALSRTITYSYQINSGKPVTFILQANNYNPSAGKMEGQWGDLSWKVDRGGNLTISGTGKMLHYSDPNGDPDNSKPSIDGYPWHKYQDIIETVIVEDGVTTLAEIAFHGLGKLQNVKLPGSLTAIGDAAFAFCPVLESVEIPGKVSSIGKEIFYECTGLKTITFTGDAPAFDPAAFGAVTLNAYYPAGNKTWTEDVRKDYGGQITWITVVTSGTCGENLTWSYNAGTLTISGTGAMYDYSKDQTKPAPWNHLAGDITKLVIEEGVTTIGDFAFAECSAIENASFPSTLTRVGKYPFYRFSRPNGNVYYQVFWSEVNQTVRQWSQIQFEGDSERFLGGDSTNFVCHSPIIASGKYGDRVYWELNENGTMEFFGSGDMEEFWATGSWLYDEYAKTIVITEGITNIGISAFEAYSPDPLSVTLESVRIASTVKRVEEMAFAGCQVLKNITFVGDAPTFGENCFRGVTATAYYPAGNATWTTDVMQDYEGNITWEAYCPGHVFEDWVIEGNTSRRTCTLCGYTEHKVTTDSGDVEIEIPEQPDLEVEVDPVLPSEDSYVLVEEAFDNVDNKDQAILKVFDINLKNADGVHVQPNGTVKVKLPLDWEKDGNYKVYRVNDDGTLTDMNAYREGSHIVFETDHFSLYVIVKEGHQHDYQKVVTAPDCTEGGFTTYTCDCGSSYVDDEVAALGHSYGKGKITTKPTCMAEGVKTYTCGTCGDTKTEPVEKDPKNHSFTKYESDNNATCKKNGTKTAKCDYGCGKTDTVTDRGSKLGHKYQGDKCIRCGVTRWNPDTGDKIMIAVATMAVSAVALLVLFVWKKRK